jgi:NAD(P)-dependent dehydrogenase (short-subunit alcohol dehydrogenase family)
MNQLKGKIAIITGANQGFGLEIAKAYAAAGADLVLCARDVQKLKTAVNEVEQIKAEGVRILFQKVDISKKKEFDQLVAYTLKEFKRLDILVANAGVYGPKGPIEEVNWDEWSEAIDINLKGTVLSCISVIPHMKQNKSGKIIILSGGGATKPMPNLTSYAVSKIGLVRFAETLALELLEFGIDVNAIAPGALNTRLLDEILDAGPEKVGKSFFEQSLKQKESGGSPMTKGASLCVFLATNESNGISGKLISAIWDPWERLNERRIELMGSDIYTLRRIVPEERGKNWT